MKYLKVFDAFFINEIFKKQSIRQFTLSDLDSSEKDELYNIFRSTYIKNTGKSWNKDKFFTKALTWEFFGDEKGFIAIKKKNNVYKLMVGAGNIHSILSALEELELKHYPVFSLVNFAMKRILSKQGYSEPSPENLNMINDVMPLSSTDYEIKDNGEIHFDYGNIGSATKYFMGNKAFYNSLVTN